MNISDLKPQIIEIIQKKWKKTTIQNCATLIAADVSHVLAKAQQSKNIKTFEGVRVLIKDGKAKIKATIWPNIVYSKIKLDFEVELT